MPLKKLPIGIENFSEFSTDDYYYVDKTGFIAELLHNRGKVNLFTRPRRFGKTLNMSMLKYFFEIGSDASIFEGLRISREKELCDVYRGQFPVISVSLKNVDGFNYQDAYEALRTILAKEALRFYFLKSSERLSDEERKQYQAIINFENKGFTMQGSVLVTSLQTLSELLFKHYGRKVILLIDEYDVPLDKAFQAGYYDEMTALIRNVFNSALKTNDSIHFAVLTGCLRISKESIFTGMNNLRVMNITDHDFSDSFGFTGDEVKALLEYYGCEGAFETVRRWYDGYHFGEKEIYCPWDVINYCQALLSNPKAYPQNYWANTSGNALIRRFIHQATAQTKNEMERLIDGESIIKPVSQELTYGEIDQSIDNLWSVLFSTGYLTQKSCKDGTNYELVIPNQEIRDLFIKEIKVWFNETAKKDHTTIERFCSAFVKEDVEQIEQQMNRYLWNCISVRDVAVREQLKENFYHGMLLGLLQYEDSWIIRSNEESGTGYSDILIKTPERVGVVIELKYAENHRLDAGCAEALKQIEEKQYDARLLEDGMETIVKYGMAFYKKQCKVVLG
jgi:hypothetical protein